MSPAVASAFGPAGTQVLRINEQGDATLGFVSGFTGGAIVADVHETQGGADAYPHKQPGRVRFEDIQVEVGPVMPAKLFDWIAGSWGPEPQVHDGAVLKLDHSFTVRTELEFGQALIAETIFPTLDGGSKAPGRVTIRISPGTLRVPTSPNVPLKVPLGKANHKLWQTSAFAFTLDGLDTKGVSRIGAFSVRRTIQSHASEAGRPPGITPGRVSFPNLRIWISAATASSWHAWHADFLVGGHNTDADERSGAISLLAPDMVTELARIELHGVGILRLAEATTDDGPDAVGRVVADLYCERMRLLAGAG